MPRRVLAFLLVGLLAACGPAPEQQSPYTANALAAKQAEAAIEAAREEIRASGAKRLNLASGRSRAMFRIDVQTALEQSAQQPIWIVGEMFDVVRLPGGIQVLMREDSSYTSWSWSSIVVALRVRDVPDAVIQDAQSMHRAVLLCIGSASWIPSGTTMMYPEPVSDDDVDIGFDAASMVIDLNCPKLRAVDVEWGSSGAWENLQ